MGAPVSAVARSPTTSTSSWSATTAWSTLLGGSLARIGPASITTGGRSGGFSRWARPSRRSRAVPTTSTSSWSATTASSTPPGGSLARIGPASITTGGRSGRLPGGRARLGGHAPVRTTSTSSWSATTAWSTLLGGSLARIGPASITTGGRSGGFPGGRARLGGRAQSQNLDLFVVGNDGVVYTFGGSLARIGPASITTGGRSGVFPGGAPVSAVARSPNNLDLFVVGNDGVGATPPGGPLARIGPASITTGGRSGASSRWRARLGGRAQSGQPRPLRGRQRRRESLILVVRWLGLVRRQ